MNPHIREQICRIALEVDRLLDEIADDVNDARTWLGESHPAAKVMHKHGEKVVVILRRLEELGA